MKTIRRYMFSLSFCWRQSPAGREQGRNGERPDWITVGPTCGIGAVRRLRRRMPMCFTSPRPAIGDGRMPTAPCIGRWMCTIPCSVPICRRRSDWPSACSPKATVSTRLITGRLPWSRGSSPIRLSGQGSPWRWKMYGRLSVTIWSTSTGAGLSYWRDTAREPGACWSC